MKIIPRGKYVLIKPDDASAKETDSGLLLPSNTEEEKKAQGTVEAVGSEVSDIKKGDRVIFGALAGEVIKYKPKPTAKEEELQLLYSDDIIAFIK